MAQLDPTTRIRLVTYCRIDSMTPDEEGLLESIYNGAVEYMANAGISEQVTAARSAEYDLCVNAMVLDAWDRRSATVSGTVLENPAFRRRMNQLKMASLVSDLSGGSML